jgi:hypothetical protein
VSRLSRRALLAAAAASVLAPPARAVAAAGEPGATMALIGREDAAAGAYARVARRTGDALLERIGGQDVRHAHALRVELEAQTITWGGPRRGIVKSDPASLRLAVARTREAALAEAITLEQELVEVYVEAARVLVDAGLLETVATIAAGHAQQLAVLRLAAGRPPIDEPALSVR